MKVGYMTKTTKEETQILLDYGVDKVIKCAKGLTELEGFQQFLIEYIEHDLVIANLSSLGESLTLVQLLDCFLWLCDQGKTLTVIKQGVTQQLSSKDFQAMVIQIGQLNRRAITNRTKMGIEKARSNGRIPGRPRTDSSTIDKVKTLYSKGDLTLKEIADLCHVSVGTVYKYCQSTK